MKFLADMGISPRCAEWLRNQGHDSVHLCELNLHKLCDRDVLHIAQSENRILLTMDLDFSDILSCFKNGDLPIVVIFRLRDQRPKNIQTILENLLPTLEQLNYNLSSAILSVSDKNIRLRRLPVKEG